MTIICWSLVSLSFAIVSSASPLSTDLHHPSSFNSSPMLAPLVTAHHPHGSINNSYIVMLKDDVPSHLKTSHLNLLQQAHDDDPLTEVGGITHIYDGHVNGYAGFFTSGVIDRIRALPEVAYVEHDQLVRTVDVQRSAPWGLARISHPSRLTFGTFSKYEYDQRGGEGVDVYVIDTGVNTAHSEFEGRALWGQTIPRNDVDADGNGHGTHVAGTIASRKYGVAKKANVIAVKVLGSNGSGSMSDVVGGVNWAVKQAMKKAAFSVAEFKATGSTKHKGSVANMSLGGGRSRVLDDTINRAVSMGVHFAVAAGNDNSDACNFSPAAAVKAVTVGASTVSDERAYFSNYGSCVDVFAPGQNIVSTYIGSEIASATLSGTSMASPHAAGLLAYLLSIYPSSDFDPSFDVKDTLISFTQTQQSFAFRSSVYAVAHASLSNWIRAFLPSPHLAEKVGLTAPIPNKPWTLSPEQLKQALVKLALRNQLASLPPQTANFLIFNNHTSY